MVIIAENGDGEALATLVLNKLRGTFNLLAVKAPGFGDRRKAMLQDIAVLTGGSVIIEEMGRKLDGTTLEDLGQCDKVVSTKDDTTIVGGQGAEEAITGRINQIKAEIGVNIVRRALEEPMRGIARNAGMGAMILTTEALITGAPAGRGESSGHAADV